MEKREGKGSQGEREKQTHHWNEMWDQERLYFHSLHVGEAGACANAEGRPQERRRTLEGRMESKPMKWGRQGTESSSEDSLRVATPLHLSRGRQMRLGWSLGVGG